MTAEKVTVGVVVTATPMDSLAGVGSVAVGLIEFGISGWEVESQLPQLAMSVIERKQMSQMDLFVL